MEQKKPVPGALPRLGFVLLAILSIFWGLGVLALARVSGSTLAIPIAELRPLILVALLNITGWHLIYAEEKERVKEDRIEINYLRGLIFPKGRCGH